MGNQDYKAKKKTIKQKKAFLLLYNHIHGVMLYDVSQKSWLPLKSYITEEPERYEGECAVVEPENSQSKSTHHHRLRMYEICSLFLSVLVLQLNLMAKNFKREYGSQNFFNVFFLYLEIGRGIVSFLFSSVLLCKWSGLQTYIF